MRKTWDWKGGKSSECKWRGKNKEAIKRKVKEIIARWMGEGREGEEETGYILGTNGCRRSLKDWMSIMLGLYSDKQTWNSAFNYMKGATCKMRPEFKGFPKKCCASPQCRSLSLMSSLQPLSKIASVEETPRATELNWTREQLRDRKYRLKVKYTSSQGERVLVYVHTYADILKIAHSTFRCSISTLEYL